MKPIRIAWCLAALTIAAGCDDQVTDPGIPTDALTTPSAEAVHVGFDQEGEWNDLMYYPCLNDGQGEVVWERGTRLDYKGRVFAPSGNANRWTWTLEFTGLPEEHPYYFGSEYTLLGLESGDVWTIENHTGEARRHDKTDGFIYQQMFNLWLVNQDGDRVHVLDKYNAHCDYDWNCTMEKVGGTCPVEWIGVGPPDPMP